MRHVIDKCEDVLYADDILIYTEGTTSQEWLNMSKFKLNKKDKDAGNRFRINYEVIEKVKKLKYLLFILIRKMQKIGKN